MSSIFEPIVDGGMVEAAARDTIQEWIETYLAEVERQRGLKPRSLPKPRSYSVATVLEKWPEDQLPAVVLVSTGIADRPRRKGSGGYDVPWALGIGVVVSARNQEAANSLAKRYTAAIRTLLLQHPSMGGFATGVEWMDESFDDVPAEKRRTLAGGIVTFRVDIANAVNAQGGPATVPADPYAVPAGWPTADTVDVDIEQEAIAA